MDRGASKADSERAGAGAPAVPPRVTLVEEAGATRLALQGDWTVETAAAAEALVGDGRQPGSGPLCIDGRGLGRFDTAGAWRVESLRRNALAAGRAVRLDGFSDGQTVLLAVVEPLARSRPERAPREAIIRGSLAKIGRESAEIADDAVSVLATLGEFVAAVGGMLAMRRRMRWPAFVNHLDRAGLQAIPIVSLMSFLIGMIIAQQGAFYFRTYGAELFVVDLVGVLVCREIGVLLTAIMVAGRSGSAFTAEIGSMKMREEIDALTVLGVSPVDVLVVPRLLALVLALPLLTLAADVAALAGSWVIVVYHIGIPSETYFMRLQEALTVTYVVVGLAKAPAMAMVIGLIACVEGMKVAGSAESLGTHTTASVVKAIFMVIVMDGVFAMFFGAIGI